MRSQDNCHSETPLFKLQKYNNYSMWMHLWPDSICIFSLCTAEGEYLCIPRHCLLEIFWSQDTDLSELELVFPYPPVAI